MGIRPDAVPQGKIDRARSFWEKLVPAPLKSTNDYTQDGDVMIWTSETGINYQVADRSSGSANEKFAGVAMSDARRITTFVNIEQKTIPAAGSYVIQLAKTQGISNTTVSCILTVAGTELFYGAATSGRFTCTTGGLLTFHSDQAGLAVTIRYSYTLTVVELDAKFPQASYAQRGQAQLNQASVAVGYCEIYTTQYNTGCGNDNVGSSGWALNDAVYTGASGLFTTNATAVAKVGRVISLPSVGDPFLGVAYQSSNWTY